MCRQFGHRAQYCPLSGRCRYCHQVGHKARECARAWDPLPSVPDISVDGDVDTSSVSDSATVIGDECDPEPVDKPSDPEPSANLPVDPVEPAPDKLSVADLVESVSNKVPVDPIPDKQPTDVPMTTITKTRVSKSSPVSAKFFCDRVSKKFDPLPFPNYDVYGKEWDSKAKTHFRLQVKAVFSAKSMAISNSDLRTWSENDPPQVTTLFCEMLSVRRDYLVAFV